MSSDANRVLMEDEVPSKNIAEFELNPRNSQKLKIFFVILLNQKFKLNLQKNARLLIPPLQRNDNDVLICKTMVLLIFPPENVFFLPLKSRNHGLSLTSLRLIIFLCQSGI